MAKKKTCSQRGNKETSKKKSAPKKNPAKKKTAKKKIVRKKAAKKPSRRGQADDSFGFLADIAGNTVRRRSFLDLADDDDFGFGGFDGDDDGGTGCDDPRSVLSRELMTLGLGTLAERLEEIELPVDFAEFVGDTLRQFREDPEAFSAALGPFDSGSIDNLLDVLTTEEPIDGPSLMTELETAELTLLPDDRIDAALEALQVMPDCLAAYVVWADAIDDEPEARLEAAETGVCIGRRLLKKANLLENPPKDFEETALGACFVRLLCSSAEALRDLGRYADAVERWREALPLTKNEQDQIRENLGEALLFTRRDGEALEVLSPLTFFLFDSSYNMALVLYRLQGDSVQARKALKIAVEQNQTVAEFLLDPDLVAEFDPEDLMADCSEEVDEAYGYVANLADAWTDTPGALAWLKKRAKIRS